MTVDLGPLDLLPLLEIVRGEMRRKNDMDEIFKKKSSKPRSRSLWLRKSFQIHNKQTQLCR